MSPPPVAEILTERMPVPLPLATAVVPLVIVTLIFPAPSSVTLIVSPALLSLTFNVWLWVVIEAAGEALGQHRGSNRSKRDR